MPQKKQKNGYVSELQSLIIEDFFEEPPKLEQTQLPDLPLSQHIYQPFYRAIQAIEQHSRNLECLKDPLAKEKAIFLYGFAAGSRLLLKKYEPQQTEAAFLQFKAKLVKEATFALQFHPCLMQHRSWASKILALIGNFFKAIGLCVSFRYHTLSNFNFFKPLTKTTSQRLLAKFERIEMETAYTTGHIEGKHLSKS